MRDFSSERRGGGVVALAATLLFTVSTLLHAQSGRVTGRVIDPGGQPLQGVRVTVLGTALVTGTNAEGQYSFTSVPAGARQLRAAILGFGAQVRSVTVVAGGVATVDFQMSSAPVQLAGVVTTATGEQRKRELGNAITQLDAAERVASKPVANMSDLLQSQAPGVQVLQSALTGGGQRIRIRGTNSLSLNNEPIFLIDGIRMTSDNNSSSIGIGGTNPSRVSDINPEEIESIEVVKGPSASTLYGTDAANGVIVIKTKRGRAGPARWTTYAELGAIKDRNEYPYAYRGWRTGPTGATTSTPTNTVQCFLFQVAAGSCTQDSVSRFNLFRDKDSSPLGTGARQQYGLQLSGGSEAVRYFMSGEWEDEVGLLRMPQFSVDSVRSSRAGVDPLPEQMRPNALRKSTVRLNVNANPNSKLDLAASTGFITSMQRLPQTDNNATGLLSNAFGGPGNKNNGRFGYRAYTPDRIFSETVTQGINRFIGSGTANYRPTPWLETRATAGLDFTSRNDSDLCRRSQCTPFSATTISGFKENNRTEFFQYTADAGATATFPVTRGLESRTSVGTQWVKRLFARNGAFAENLPPGASQVSAGATPSASEAREESKTLGAFIEEQLGWRDRLFVTGAVRADDNSAFGRNFNAVYYPKLSVSWVASEEPFFPRLGFLGMLRLRFAAGASGTQPGATDALLYYAPSTTNLDVAGVATDVPSVSYAALGNPNLKPERATEMEGGADVSFLRDRVSLELTYYSRLTEDALVSVPIPPSVGVAISRFMNIGSVKNAGAEFGVHTRLLEHENLGIDLSVTGSVNHNKLVTLGVDPANGAAIPPIIATTRQQRPGYPLDGLWSPRIVSYSDANGDGIIALSEIVVTDTAEYIGPDRPTREISFNLGTELLRRRLRFSTLIDHKGGYWLLNGTERIRCESRSNCAGLVDRNSSFFQQARATVVRTHGTRSQAGFMERADSWRLREVAMNYTIPESWLGRMRAHSATLTVAARNLKVWSGYTGIDPESNYFEGARGTQSDFQTQPPPSYFTFRLTLGL